MWSGVGGKLKSKSSKKPKEDAILFTLPVFCEQRKMGIVSSYVEKRSTLTVSKSVGGFKNWQVCQR